MEKPQIDYPCEWSYRIMGEDEKVLRALVNYVLDQSQYSLTLSNKTSSGKYTSLNLKTVVDSAEHRDRLWNALSESPAVKMVL